MRNPFVPTFGATPPLLVGRDRVNYAGRSWETPLHPTRHGRLAANPRPSGNRRPPLNGAVRFRKVSEHLECGVTASPTDRDRGVGERRSMRKARWVSKALFQP